jgi:transketolase
MMEQEIVNEKTQLDQLCINTLRFLAVDGVEQAKNGHPGAPLGCAPIAYLLFQRIMNHDPADPQWIDRDRFVLSNGHASMLLYGALHLSGYRVSIEDLQQFRQWGSITPGHPEYHQTPGVEVTTGPLGQGFAMAVGFAVAERHLAATYNRDHHAIIDHYTYVLCGDGDLMEGISHEAASLAGTLGLGKLIVLYDDNLISLDGPTDLSFTEDVSKRFEAYNWHVQNVGDGNDTQSIEKAIEAARDETHRPSLIRVRTVIGYGSPLAGTNKVHGEAMGSENIKATKRNLNWSETSSFYVPPEARTHWNAVKARGGSLRLDWLKRFEEYKLAYPQLALQLERCFSRLLPKDWNTALPLFPAGTSIATRNASQQVMQAIEGMIPELFGGAADLTSSTKTIFRDKRSFHVDPTARNVFFGVREFGMGAMVNGMAAHGGLIPFGSTFFMFSDYCRSAIRMAALMGLHSLFIFTHDSIALGADGPTHQPVEHLMSLRAIPDLTDFRPADANETAACWRLALERKGASFMALSRQDLPVLDPECYGVAEGVSFGAYALEASSSDDVILIATGAEVSLIMEAARQLKTEGIAARVVSMPSFRIFEEQDESYKESLLQDEMPKLAVEAGATMGWWKYVGSKGKVIGVDRFGASAPGPIVMEKYGISVQNIVDHARKLVQMKSAHC